MRLFLYTIALSFTASAVCAQQMPTIDSTAPVQAEILDGAEEDLEDYIPPTMFDPAAPKQANPVQKAVSEDTAPKTYAPPPTTHRNRKTNIPRPPRRPSKVRVSQDFLEQLKQRDIPLENAIIDADINDVLHQIDPNEQPVPPPKTPRQKTFKQKLRTQNDDLIRVTSPPRTDYHEISTDIISIPFPSGSHTFIPNMSAPSLMLRNQIKTRDMDRIRIEVYGYAWHEQRNKAIDLAYQRVLALQTYLIAHHIPAHKIDLRVMGRKTDNPMTDRVDVVFRDIY